MYCHSKRIMYQKEKNIQTETAKLSKFSGKCEDSSIIKARKYYLPNIH